MNDSLCYCTSGKIFSKCCEPFINKRDVATTAEQLMRSRYSAYCHNNAAYLVNTHWPISPNSKPDIQRTIDTTQWIGLKIINTKLGREYEQTGEVEFVAFYQDNGIQQLHENSQFIRHSKQWYYLNGKQLPPIKLNRNENCFCGSGKKFKKCHI
ncbi:YchJ family protein [Aliikangiella sp. IMCC44359]|uniref:YchJ family protein n=1 Tax=Aliikangiella sp. IMCC44359 TaxID=3459125 RepID=UPI00403B0BEF